MSNPNRTEVNFTYSVPNNMVLAGRSVVLVPRIIPQPGVNVTLELIASFMNRTWSVSGQPQALVIDAQQLQALSRGPIVL